MRAVMPNSEVLTPEQFRHWLLQLEESVRDPGFIRRCEILSSPVLGGFHVTPFHWAPGRGHVPAPDLAASAMSLNEVPPLVRRALSLCRVIQYKSAPPSRGAQRVFRDNHLVLVRVAARTLLVEPALRKWRTPKRATGYFTGSGEGREVAAEATDASLAGAISWAFERCQARDLE